MILIKNIVIEGLCVKIELTMFYFESYLLVEANIFRPILVLIVNVINL